MRLGVDVDGFVVVVVEVVIDVVGVLDIRSYKDNTDINKKRSHTHKLQCKLTNLQLLTSHLQPINYNPITIPF